MPDSAKSNGNIVYRLAFALLLFAHPLYSFAAVYKCTGPDGKLTYGDTPCAANESSQQVTITPAPLHTTPASVGSQSFPATHNREVGVNLCTAKAFMEWQKSQAPNLQNPHARTEKLSEIRAQCQREAGPLPESQPVKRDPAIECRIQRFSEYIRANTKNLPPQQVQIAKEAEFYEECKRSLASPATTASAPISVPISSPTAAAPRIATTPAPQSSPTTPKVEKENAPVTGKDPLAIVNALVDRIYVIGETSGKGAGMIAAEASAADAIRTYMSSGSTEGLLAKEKGQQSPLAAAAYMGYPNVVAALLTSDLVKAHINDADDKGMTPWIASNFSLRQSLGACNPSMWEDPFKLVPMLVTQPYYLSNPTPPYKKTRELLEKAGAAADQPKAKELWLAVCKSQSEAGKAKVQASTDLQKVAQELGALDLATHLLEMQKKATATQQK